MTGSATVGGAIGSGVSAVVAGGAVSMPGARVTAAADSGVGVSLAAGAEGVTHEGSAGCTGCVRLSCGGFSGIGAAGHSQITNAANAASPAPPDRTPHSCRRGMPASLFNAAFNSGGGWIGGRRLAGGGREMPKSGR